MTSRASARLASTKNNSMSKKDIEIINSMERWAEISEEWDKLLSESTADSIFLTWEWLYSWAETYLDKDRRLFIVAVYDADGLAGIAPWYIHTFRSGGVRSERIEFIGSPEAGSDYLDVITRRGSEKVVADKVYSFLFEKTSEKWDGFFLKDIPSDSTFLLHFLSIFRKNGKYIELRPGSLCPALNLPDSVEEFFSDLSSNRREQFRRHWRLLKNSGECLHYTLRPNVDREALGMFLDLYKKRWQEDGEENLPEFVERLAKRTSGKDYISIDFLSVDGRDIAGLLHLKYNNRLLMYLMGVDKEYNRKISVGNVLVGLCIKKAIGEGVTCYDFLKGSENYKFHWTTDGTISLNMVFYRKNASAIIPFLTSTARSLGKIILR